MQRDTPLPVTDRTRAVAVLPFVNLSGDPEDEYLGDGIAEEIISALARVQSLRVAARTSSFRYRGQHMDVRATGAALGVGAVLEDDWTTAQHAVEDGAANPPRSSMP